MRKREQGEKGVKREWEREERMRLRYWWKIISINALMNDITFTMALPWRTHQRWPSAVGSSSEQRPGGT